ncbi:hypothetical protein Vadar_002208 [Vaccinium darrowii]|uniref:Uncharacterized protein n=1 Tax=Vaccinium darrowii TaxID=229202 RepID=A0ACB7Z0Z3_9ERIC|nr:hypothetical protein Vadar_002208 [Vaccinium darrowii]
MLSSENPRPSSDVSDPPSTSLPCEISKLNSGGGDERASHDKVPVQEDGVDLLKSGFDYDNNPLPKFSIRDYVFSARSKDINTNWPFSQKNLQLCLKHGVKDLLPPFQPLESVGYRCIEQSTAETSLINKQNITDLDGKPSFSSMASDHFLSASSDNPGSCSQNLAVDIVDIGLEGSEGVKRDNQVQLTTNSQSHCETDSIPADKSQSKNQTQIKKCRLVVKVGSGVADPSSNGDHVIKSVAVSETMASNVCPVCRTFTSYSNTTLNAHIDQCLSPESNMGWPPNSRVIKHRIKSRKMRLMTDIYATAPYCTLEELDRRNGTNWALNTSFPTQENVDCVEEEKERVALVNLKEKGDEGAVYIDANGTKVRILSKFNDASSSVPAREGDLRTQKILKGGSGSKLVSKYKKRHHAQKHLKLPLQSKQFCSSKPRRTPEVRRDGERNVGLVENCMKVGSLPQPLKAQEQIKPDESGTMMKWACSKRTVLFKKRNLKEGLQHLGRNFSQEFPAESDQPSLGDSYTERSVRKTPNLYESPLSSPENRKRMRDLSFKTPFRESNEEPRAMRKDGFTPFVSQTERFLESPQRGAKQLRLDSTSGDASCKGLANNGERYVPLLGKEPVEMNANLHSNPSRNHHVFSSKAPKFSSLKKHVLSAGQSVVPISKCKAKKKFPCNKKSGMRCSAESIKEVMALPSKVVDKHDSKQKYYENQSQIPGKASVGRNGVLKLRKKRGALGISQNAESRPLKSAVECHSHEIGNDLDSSARVCCDYADTFGDKVISPSLGVDLGGNGMSLSRSLAPDFQKLGSPSMGDEQEMFCLDKAGDNMVAENTDVGDGGMDSKDGLGNYFSGVDPIPIPGPPGSFLPSPRDMGSEDLQGNSSITTSRVHSSEDHHDLVDRDSSDSPISVTSTISNSTVPRPDSKSSENLFTKDEIGLGISVARRCDASAENSTVPVPQAATIQSGRANLHDEGFTGFRNDQPCCCSRKEGMSQGVSLNYQESQLLRRRTMASVPMGKQPSFDSNRRPNGLNSMPEMISIDNFHVTKSAVVPVSVQVSSDSALNSPAFGDCDSASPSPSASNSVLRLMGKNLMVVNKDEHVSQHFKPVPSDHPSQHFQKLSGFSSGNNQSEGFPSFYRMVHQHPNTGFGSYATSKTPQESSSPLASSGAFFSKNVGGYNFPHDQYRSWNRNADNTTNSMKEIILIDETPPRRKAGSAADIAQFSENIMENRVSSAGIPIQMAANYNSRYMNPFYSYQPQGYSPDSESKPHMTQTASFQIPPHRSSLYYSPSFS